MAGLLAEGIDVLRFGFESVVELAFDGMEIGRRSGFRHRRHRVDEAEFFDDVVDGEDELGVALLDEPVGARAGAAVDGAGQGEHLTVLLNGHARRDERPTFLESFHHKRAERKPADDAVSAGEVGRIGFCAEWLLRHDGPAPGDVLR